MLAMIDAALAGADLADALNVVSYCTDTHCCCHCCAIAPAIGAAIAVLPLLLLLFF